MFGVAMETGYGRQFPTKSALSPESAIAADIFDQFIGAQTFKSVLGTFRVLCDTLRLKPTIFPLFYPKLKAKLRSWKAQALWSKFDKRSAHKCYNRARACAHSRVLIIGAGPCGLRTAIEAQLLGAKVVVIEKRDRISRNNVLHLWPFVIHDLRALGAKKFFGKFCAGAIDHISIRQLQCVLLKVALLLGVEIHENVAFEAVKEPPNNQAEEKIGWRASVSPEDHPVSQYEFDVLIGADGKRNTLQGFRRKEFRGKLAIAITANFINHHSEAEARVEEISGVAFIFNQKFFQDMREQTGIDLENIVYYKDDTHYFVMTAKKLSLIEKGVILQDYSDTAKLLAPDNVSREALMYYAREAADFATNCQLPCLEFAVNHYGQADVAMFDFTSMYAAESASKVIEKRGHRLLMGLVGDSLLEPFWPTGSGCARGFLSSLDACWMMRSWSMGNMTPLQVLAERESIYRLLAQTTPENLNKDYSEITLNPQSRYPNLNMQSVRPIQVRSLYDSDIPISDENLELPIEMPKKKRKKDSIIHPDTLLTWCKKQVALYDNVVIEDLTSSWKNGLALCAIIHHYRPDLIDYHSLKEDDVAKNNQLAFNICEQEFGISPIMTGEEMAECPVPDKLTMVSYVNQLYDNFRGEIPHVARNTVDLSPEDKLASPPSGRRTPGNRLSLLTRLSQALTAKKQRLHAAERMEREQLGVHDRFDRRAKKRRSLDKERALFILNNNEQKTAHLPNLQKGMGEKVPFSDRIKTLEGLLSGQLYEERHEAGLIYHLTPSEMEARFTKPSSNAPCKTNKVGRLEKGDWNLKMLEERLKERQTGGKKDAETVPKWNRNCFEDKLRAMDCKLNKNPTEDVEKFIDFDQRIRKLDQKLKEGTVLERGQRGSNKVSAMAEQLAAILEPKQEHPPLIRSNSRPNIGHARGGSETCHFCSKRVYLMERMSAQGKFFHRGCFKCEYCGTGLRLGSYGYAADGNFGGKFLCMQHFGMPLLSPRKRPADVGLFLKGKKIDGGTPAKMLAADKLSVQPLTAQKIFLDVSDAVVMRGATPERVEFENSLLDLASEEEILSEIDEDEWTDRNFGTTTTTDLDSTDDDESDFSSEEISEDDQVFEEAFQRSFTSDETRRLAESWKCRYSQGKKVDQNGAEIEESEEEYGESDDEFSYQAYEDDGVIQEEESEDDGESSSSSSSEKLKKLSGPQGKIQPIDETEVVVLASEQEESDDETEVGSDDSSSDEYSESADEEDGDDDDKVNSSITHNIPSIIINEPPPNQLEVEDEELFYKFLQQQKQPLIADSIASTPMTEDERPICKISPSASYYALDEILSEFPTPVDESEGQNCVETPIASTESESFSETRFVDDEVVEGTEMEMIGTENGAGDVAINTPIVDDENDQIQGIIIDEVVEKRVELEENKIVAEKFVISEDSTVSSSSIPNEITPETENEDEATEDINSISESSEYMVKFRSRNSHSVDRDLMTKSVIEPLERCSSDGFNNVVQTELSPEPAPADTKVLEPAVSLPNLTENILETPPVEDRMTQKILKLKERYLLGESPGSTDQVVKNAEVKVCSPAKIEPVVKSVLEMISEKQKMLSPAPSLSLPIRSLNDLSPDLLISGSLPKSYKLHESHLLNFRTNTGCAELKNQATVYSSTVDKASNLTANSASESSAVADEATRRELIPGKITTTSCRIENESVNEKSSDVVGQSLENRNDNEINRESVIRTESVKKVDNDTRAEKELVNEDDDIKNENVEGETSDFNIDTTFVTFRRKRVHSKSDSFLDSSTEDKVLNARDSENNNITISDNTFDKPKESKKCEEVQRTEAQKQVSSVSPTYKYEGRFSQKVAPMGSIRALIENRNVSAKRTSDAKREDEVNKNAHNADVEVSAKVDRVPEMRKELKPILRSLPTGKKLDNRRSIHEEIEEIPFADDDSNVDGHATPKSKSKFYTPQTSFKTVPSTFMTEEDANNELFYTPIAKMGDPLDLRMIKTVERERARQEARERARLKSDEELGLSPAFYSNLLRKGSKDGDIINGDVKSDEEPNSVDSTSSSDASKTDGGHYLETELSVDDTELQMTPAKEKGLSWSGFGKSKQDSGKVKTKDPRRSFLSLFASLTKMEPVKARGKENSKKSAAKVSSPESETGAKEKFGRLKLNRSKEKTKEKDHDSRRKSLPKTVEDIRCLKELNKPKVEGTRPERPKELLLDKTMLRHNMAEMMQPSKLLQAGTSNSAPRASEDSFSESDDEDTVDGNGTGTVKRAKEITEQKLKKLQRIAQRVYRQQEQKRLRMAQEIQRQLEELEVKQHELEERGVHVEKALRSEGDEADKQKEEAELMQEWFHLVHEKNVLVRYEQELMVRARELELEDRHSRLQQSLREKMAVEDSQKSQEQIEEEGRILAEMLEIVEQRDDLVAMLEEERRRYEVEDEDLETSLLAKGYNLSPPSKT